MNDDSAVSGVDDAMNIPVSTRKPLLDIGLTSSIPWREFDEILKVADHANAFHALWIGEDIDYSRNVFIQAFYALSRTRLNVGIGVTSIYYHKLVNIARAAATLNEAGKERFRLGIGVGGLKILSDLGIKVEKPLQAMREATILLRKIWNGEKVTFKGFCFAFDDYIPYYTTFSKIPLYFGVRGKKLLELAGEMADGVIISGPKTYMEKAIELFKSKSENSDKRIVVWLPTILIERREDLEFAKKVVALVLADTPPQVIQLSGIDPTEAEKIRELYIKGNFTRAIECVSDEVLNEMLFYGEVEEVCNDFASLGRYGVHEVVFGPPFGRDANSAVRKISRVWRDTV